MDFHLSTKINIWSVRNKSLVQTQDIALDLLLGEDETDGARDPSNEGRVEILGELDTVGFMLGDPLGIELIDGRPVGDEVG